MACALKETLQKVGSGGQTPLDKQWESLEYKGQQLAGNLTMKEENIP
jgi:hypothetical protein